MGNISTGEKSNLVKSLLQERSEKMIVDFLKRVVRGFFTTTQADFFGIVGYAT